MEIKQKKLSNQHTFTFNEHSLNFAFKNKSGAEDVDVEYGTFPDKSSLLIEQNDWLRNVGILWFLLGALNIGRAVFSDNPVTGTGLWLFLGIICLIWFAVTKVRYSVFKTETSNIFVIQNGQHDHIIDEISKRKKAQLLQWYGDVNVDNDPESEINKFRWLAEQNVITKVQAEEKIAQVEFAHKDPDLQHKLN